MPESAKRPPKEERRAPAASTAPARTPGQRAGLTREGVIAEAGAVLAEEGLQKLSMRRLAQRLGVAPNALYSHVSGRTDLIDALLDETLAEVQAPGPARDDWRSGVETIMRRTYTVLLAHPDLVGLYVARRGARGPRAVALGDTILALLARAGIEGEPARQALRALIVHTIGFAAFAVQDPLSPTETVLTPRAVEEHFVKSLRWLLDGVAADVDLA
jgi:TetR/AcrR family transcriptional regulator, tetracycline repressor protein